MIAIAREKIALTDEEIERLFDDKCSLGVSVEKDLCFGLASELDAFRTARKGWACAGTIERDEPSCLMIDAVQAIRGQRRRTVALVLVGNYVAIYGADR